MTVKKFTELLVREMREERSRDFRAPAGKNTFLGSGWGCYLPGERIVRGPLVPGALLLCEDLSFRSRNVVRVLETQEDAVGGFSLCIFVNPNRPEAKRLDTDRNFVLYPYSYASGGTILLHSAVEREG